MLQNESNLFPCSVYRVLVLVCSHETRGLCCSMRCVIFIVWPFSSRLCATRSVQFLFALAMASGHVAARNHVEALQRSLEEEKVAHRQCQLRMKALTMELHLSQKKVDDLEKRLQPRRPHHPLFKQKSKKAYGVSGAGQPGPDN